MAPYVASRKFCCCLPVRLGVFIITILGTAGGGIVAGFGWKQVVELGKSNIGTADKIALYIQTVMYTLLCVLSIFGFVGAIIKKRSLISVYATMLFFHFGFSVASGAFYLWSLFHARGDDDIDQCVNGSDDKLVHDVCKGSMGVFRAVAVTVFIVVWLIELWGCFIVSDYSGQLAEERSAEESARAISPPQPQMATTYNSYGGAGSKAGGYTFSAPDHSYGGSRA